MCPWAFLEGQASYRELASKNGPAKGGLPPLFRGLSPSVDATASSCIVPYNSFCLIDYALDNAFSVTVDCMFFFVSLLSTNLCF